MSSLENKIPPPLVLLITLVLMKFITYFDDARHEYARHLFPVPDVLQLSLAIGLTLTGIFIAVLGILRFREKRTTVNPLRPEEASSLVTSGVFRFTRNPMYLGLALIAFGWGIYLGSIWALSGVIMLVLFINRFQVQPEERAMHKLFDQEFKDYCKRTRRWI